MKILNLSKRRVKMLHVDITSLKVDAIVNAANQSLLGGGGVDGAIHKAAGPALLSACRQLPEIKGVRCEVGSARVTPAFNLDAQWIIHAVGPRYGIDTPSEKFLISAYENAMNCAEQHGALTMAFPAISCGIYGYPMADAAKTALRTVANHDAAVSHVTFALFSLDALQIWMSAAQELWSA